MNSRYILKFRDFKHATSALIHLDKIGATAPWTEWNSGPEGYIFVAFTLATAEGYTEDDLRDLVNRRIILSYSL